MMRRTVLALCAGACVTPARALYDPPPDARLAAVQGEWVGTLTYRDYGVPDRKVTLATRLFVALGAADELILHYVFAEGPGKTVFSSERMQFDFPGAQLTWTTGIAERKVSAFRIVSVSTGEPGLRLVFERGEGGAIERFTMGLGARALSLDKDEVDVKGTSLMRNRYAFTRP
jgi:hypothetical protein